MILNVFGLSSNKMIATLDTEGATGSLIDFLRANNIPVASSCYGEGVCRKCIVNDDLLSCQEDIQNLQTNTINIDYL